MLLFLLTAHPCTHTHTHAKTQRDIAKNPIHPSGRQINDSKENEESPKIETTKKKLENNIKRNKPKDKAGHYTHTPRNTLFWRSTVSFFSLFLFPRCKG